jgi:triosephosphate isomerase
MNLSRAEGVALAKAIADQSGAHSNIDLAVCPPSLYLDSVGQALQGSKVGLGAQNMYHEAGGAYTGEISAAMLLDLGCQYVILGHSERRHILGETDQAINLKVKAALEAGLTPIVCVGETLEEREQDRTKAVVEGQFDGSLQGLTNEQIRQIVIAYEPVWAIGTGKVATPEQAEQVHADLRRILENRYNATAAEVVRIQYGGSVKPDNAADLMSQPNIDGALVGGASLKADSFLGIAAAAV